jgi:hypothetical protein
MPWTESPENARRRTDRVGRERLPEAGAEDNALARLLLLADAGAWELGLPAATG